MSKVPIYCWDFTLSVKKSTGLPYKEDDHIIIWKELESFCKKFTFQVEKGYAKDDDIQADEWDENDSDISEYDNSDYIDTSSEYNSEFDSDSDYIDENDSNSDRDSEDEGYSSSEDEESDNYYHYQGRISVIKKVRFQQLRGLLVEHNLLMQRAHFTPTNNSCNTGNFFYVMKLQTKVEGPWSDTDEREVPLVYQCKIIKDNLYPWQEEIRDRILYPYKIDDKIINDTRTVNILYAKKGCEGKTSLAQLLCSQKLINIIPPFDKIEDIMQCAMCQPEKRGYIIDFPRSIRGNPNQFYSGIEQIRSGFVYDRRYKYQFKIINALNTQVWVMSNILPEKKYLSIDRWKIWCIENNELFLYNPNRKAGHVKGPEIVYPPSDSEEEEEDEEECIKCSVDERGYCDDHYTISDYIKNEEENDNPEGCIHNIVNLDNNIKKETKKILESISEEMNLDNDILEL